VSEARGVSKPKRKYLIVTYNYLTSGPSPVHTETYRIDEENGGQLSTGYGGADDTIVTEFDGASITIRSGWISREKFYRFLEAAAVTAVA
jgi:hypothetical protein